MSDIANGLDKLRDFIPADDESINFLIDSMAVDSTKFGMTEMDSIAKRVDRLPWSKRVRKEALVANRKHVLGLLMLYKQFSQNSREIRIFRKVEDAEAWLEEKSD